MISSGEINIPEIVNGFQWTFETEGLCQVSGGDIGSMTVMLESWEWNYHDELEW